MPSLTPAQLSWLKQTVEIRSADGSADVYLLIASLAVAMRYGLEHPKGLEIARDTYVDVNIHRAENVEVLNRLKSLPVNCAASADCLDADRAIFEAKDVFAPGLIDGIITKLRAYDQAEADRAKNDPELMLDLVHRYFHCG